MAEVTGEWRRLHNDELNDLYSSPNIVRVIKWRRIRWAGHVARMDEEREVYRVLVGKPEGKRPLGRPRHRCLDNIRIDLQDVGCGYVDWIGLAQDRDRWRRLLSAYGCETWSLTLREERKLRVFENMVLRRIFGPRRDEVTVEWRRLHNADLNYL
jgi:hypothetical protein